MLLHPGRLALDVDRCVAGDCTSVADRRPRLVYLAGTFRLAQFLFTTHARAYARHALKEWSR